MAKRLHRIIDGPAVFHIIFGNEIKYKSKKINVDTRSRKPLNQQWYIQKKTEVVKGGLCSETVPAVVPTSVCHNKIARGSEIQ